ncbi:MAG: hypothetical protein ACJ79A_09575 [Gemmatimonadaceae bacterium]
MYRIRATVLMAMLVLGATPASGSGQSMRRDTRRDETSDLMVPGARVRVKLPGEHAWTGTLVSVDGDSMLVYGTSASDTTLVRLSQATHLDVSAGRSSRHAVRTTAIGFGLGALIGWQVGRANTRGGCQKGDPCWDNFCFLCDYVSGPPNPPVTDHAAAGTVIGGLAGGALGLLVGRYRTEDWRPVSVARRRTTVTLSPGGGSVAFAF